MNRNLTMKVLSLLSLLVFVFGNSHGLSRNETIHGTIRNRRGIKDAFPRDDVFSLFGTVKNTQSRLKSLETSMKKMETEMEHMSQVESGIQSQLAVMEELKNDVSELKGAFESHSDALGEIDKMVTPDESLYTTSNRSCGGVLVAQFGLITFSPLTVRGKLPSSCVWTIRANNREKVKIMLEPLSRVSYYTGNNFVYVLELNRNEEMGFTAKTKLEYDNHQIFSGPLLFVVLPLTGATVGLNLRYEGFGKHVSTSTHYSHANLVENSGGFNGSLVDGKQGTGNKTYSIDFTTVVVSNFSSKVYLQVNMDFRKCSPEDFVIVMTDMTKNASTRDCCRQSCMGRHSILNSGVGPYVIIAKKNFQKSLDFALDWIAEPTYQSSSSGGSSYYSTLYYPQKCGEVLGGTSGRLFYKPSIRYNNGERCVWVIVPQPTRSYIVITVTKNGLHDSDHLYMMELTDVNGTALQEGPRITRLNLGYPGTHLAHSRELYIVFYSDIGLTGLGFSLTWESRGDDVKVDNDVWTTFHILKQSHGAMQTKEVLSSFTNDSYEVFIVQPVILAADQSELYLRIRQTSPLHTKNGNCVDTNVKLYDMKAGGMFEDEEILCNAGSGNAIVGLEDGLSIITLSNNDASKVGIEFSWSKGFEDANSTFVLVKDNQCGGVLKGSSGLLKYKPNINYVDNERCIWLIESPGHSSITLRLVRSRFENCCDYITATTIDPESGTLRNDAVKISRSSPIQIVNGSAVVLVFKSDRYTIGEGFILRFTGTEKTETLPYRYLMHFYNAHGGVITYPGAEWEEPVPGLQDIVLIAHSINIHAEEDPLALITKVQWLDGYLGKANDSCDYDTISFYSQNATGWSEESVFPNENDIASCSEYVRIPKNDNLFIANYSAFLAIYKRLRKQAFENESGVQLGISFSFRKDSGCGGIRFGDSGSIRYKLNTYYSIYEQCMWLVHAPQAETINFRIKTAGFEKCCDGINIIHLDRMTGSPVEMMNLTNGPILEVEGPVAVVVFFSDSMIVGKGFHLEYSTKTKVAPDFPYRYRLYHTNDLGLSVFAFEVQSNEIVVIARNAERRTERHVPATNFTVRSMRPQMNEQCESDTLTIYGLFGSVVRRLELTSNHSFGLKEDLQRRENDPGNCTPLKDSDFQACSEIAYCVDAPEGNIFRYPTASILAVYKAVNASDDELSRRGFVLDARTIFSNTIQMFYTNHSIGYGNYSGGFELEEYDG